MNNKLPSLKQQAIIGTKWVGISNIIVTILLFVRISVLGRLLEPSDFGLMSMIMVVINFGLVFSDIGISKAIIYKQNITREQLSSLYWASIIIGNIIMLGSIATAPLIAAFYHEKRLILLIIYTSITFPITAVGQQFQVLLEKEMIFDKLALAEIIATFIGTFFSIICAFYGYGVFALIIGQIIATVVKTMLILIIGLKTYKPIFYFNFKIIKEFLGFGLFQMGERCIDCLTGNVDYILIGRFLGSEILGKYFFAYQLVLMPLSKINPILTKVAFPLFSKKQADNQALNKGYIELNKLIAYLVIPLLIGLAVTAPVAIPLIFGVKWIDSVMLIQILTFVGIFKALCNPIGTIQLAKGRADIGFYWNVIVFISTTLFLYLAIRKGVIVLASTYVVISIINFIVGLFIIKYLTGIEILKYFIAVSKPGKYSAIMGIVVYMMYVILKDINVYDSILFGMMVLLGAMTYFLLAFIFDRDYCLDLWKSLIYNR